MLRCKVSYVDICPIEEIRLVGNSVVAWPQTLKNCRRIPHPLRETKQFLRDKILCKASGAHVGNVQNNLSIGDYRDKNVAMFRATDTVLDCGQGVIIDFPEWRAMREMLLTNKPEVALNTKLLLRLAGNAEEEVAAGLAEEVPLGDDQTAPEAAVAPASAVPTKRPSGAAVPTKRPSGAAAAAAALEALASGRPVPALSEADAVASPLKRQRLLKSELDTEADPLAWMGKDLPEYPSSINLVSDTEGDAYRQLLEETLQATVVAYDAQWAPDFDESTDNPIAILQLAFPITGNTYVLQLPMLERGIPAEVRELFERGAVRTAGFAAGDVDANKLEISGVGVDRASLIDVQPWCEAEMGENESVKRGWRVGLKRATNCVLDFEMDKTSTVASSNWERDELTPAQVEYAAMDVWVALRLYQRLAPAYRP